MRLIARAVSTACYNVTSAGARRRSSPFKVFAMWYTWTALLVSCALVQAEGEVQGAVATTRAPPRTLDRQSDELAWRTWLQSPESGNQNAPPRRITTKSLFITPLVCPKGQRLDRNGCVQVVTVNKDEHERILLEQLNALFTSAPSGDVLYDYGDEELGPLQLTIPIGLDPQASPLQGQEPSAQAQEQQPNIVQIDKKGSEKPNNDAASIEAELELLKLQQAQNTQNDTGSTDGAGILNHNVLNNLLHYPEKPKRDSPMVNSSEELITNATDEGQKELVYGHVNVDPILLHIQNQNQENTKTEVEINKTNESTSVQTNATVVGTAANENKNMSALNSPDIQNETVSSNVTTQMLKKDQTKLNPENDYADIGEAIKLISRYAEVTTDDNYSKDQNKFTVKEDNVLGTRTRLQHRRNKPKPPESDPIALAPPSEMEGYKGQFPSHLYPKNQAYYRYPWPSEHSPTPPPDYPFRHLQDYWPGRTRFGGVYNTAHENPRRHHHSYPHNYFRPHGYPIVNHPGPYPGLQEVYPGQMQGYPRHIAPHHESPVRPHTNNQDLYNLLGLRHWFSSEGTSKR